jgi:hypothetical protein
MTEFPGEDEGRPSPNTDPDTEPGTRSEPEEGGRPYEQPDYETEPGRGSDPTSSAGTETVAEEGAHPLVEETMERLGDLRDRPVSEHAEVYADLHERLQAALSEADAADSAAGMPAGRAQ